MAKRNQPLSIRDAGKVRLGAIAPSLPKSIKDAGKVRLGAIGPAI